MMELPQILTDSAQQYSEKTALIFAPTEVEMNYRELEEKSNRFAHALQELGIEKGDRVAIVLPNSFEVVISFFGILKAGAIVVPLNPRYTPAELQGILSDSGTKIVISLDQMVPLFTQLKEKTALREVISAQTILELVNRYPPEYAPVKINPANDLAVLQYTAGTISKPKGVMITHKNMVATMNQLQAAVQFEKGREKHLLVVPPFHVAGLVDCIGVMVFMGGTTILMPKFSPLPTLEAIEKYKPTWFFGVPAIYQAFLGVIQKTGEKWDLDSLKFCASGTAKCPLPVLRAFQEIGVLLVEGYGLTETTGVCFVNPIRGKNKLGSVGPPFPTVEVKIVDPDSDRELPAGERGEILIRGPNIAIGYWNLPEETEKTFKKGWLYTGDIGFLDEEGYLFIMDRVKDIINVRGEKVSSVEVEEVLQSHPQVAEVAVIGVPHSYWGEEVVAYVVPKEPVETTFLQKYCQDRLVDYKVPKRIITVSSLPRSSMGKILKRELKKQAVNPKG